jgi:hypothetical protein
VSRVRTKLELSEIEDRDRERLQRERHDRLGASMVLLIGPLLGTMCWLVIGAAVYLVVRTLN